MKRHLLIASLPLGTALTVLIIGIKGEIFWFLRASCKRHPFPLAHIQ